MKIETDRATFSAGVRHGFTMGSPITLTVANRDFESWGDVMKAEPVAPYAHDSVKTRPIEVPRPGHVDYAGGVKYRTTATICATFWNAPRRAKPRCASPSGSVARAIIGRMRHFHRLVTSPKSAAFTADCDEIPRRARVERVRRCFAVRCLDEDAARKPMIAEIDAAREARRYRGRRF